MLRPSLRLSLRPVHLFVLALGLAACDSNGSGTIARTDADGNVIEDDSRDWNPRCGSETEGAMCAEPAYPNPLVVSSGAYVVMFKMPVGIPFAQQLRVTATRAGVEQVLFEGPLAGGHYPLQLEMNTETQEGEPGEGLYKINIEGEDGMIRGDFLIERP